MDKESDRQRVLIQITQNLATRIRNSHAFNLPTFYLPHADDGGLPCTIPNAIEDVCSEVDKVWHGGTRGQERSLGHASWWRQCLGPLLRQRRISAGECV